MVPWFGLRYPPMARKKLSAIDGEWTNKLWHHHFLIPYKDTLKVMGMILTNNMDITGNSQINYPYTCGLTVCYFIILLDQKHG